MSRAPYSEETERTILGAILLDSRQPNECLLQAVDKISAGDFFLDSHRQIFNAFLEICKDEKPLDSEILIEFAVRTGLDKKIGGIDYLTDLGRHSIRLKNIQHYCETLKKYSAQRQLINASEVAIRQAYDLDDPGEISAQLQAHIDSVTSRIQLQNCVHVSQIGPALCRQMIEDFDKGGDTVGLPTGIGRLDRAIGGLAEGENIVIAAYTGGGKTAFALNVVEVNCPRDIPVTVYSFELKRFDLLIRLAAKRCGIPQIRIRNKAISRAELTQLLDEIGEIQRWPLWIDDRSGMTAKEFYASVRMQAARGSRLGVVDYVQLLANNCPGFTVREKVNCASGAVKSAAKDSKMPILNLSQLSRPNEKAAPRKPTIYDLKESGNIEQDAHSVILLYREFLVDDHDQAKPTGNDALILGKNRNGPTLEIAAEYDGPLMHWKEKQSAIPERNFYGE
jgi:replicative DNA helicase